LKGRSNKSFASYSKRKNLTKGELKGGPRPSCGALGLRGEGKNLTKGELKALPRRVCNSTSLLSNLTKGELKGKSLEPCKSGGVRISRREN